MIRLTTTTQTLEIVLAGAVTTNELPVVVSYSDKTATTYDGGTQPANTNGTTPVTICAAPSASTVRDIDFITVKNADTVAASITISFDNNGTGYELVSLDLAVGDQAIYVHGSGWQAIGIDGQLKTSGTGGGSGTVTSVGGTGTVNGITLTGTVTSSGNLTLGGALSGVDLTTQVTGTLPVANGGTGVTSSTGSGSVVLSTSPTLVTPVLDTPSSGTLTNCTGLPISTGVSGLGTGVATFLGTPSSANLAAAVTDETGSGALVFATSPTLVTPVLGTPSSGTLTSCTGLPISTGVSGLGTGVATFLATPSSANLAAAVTGETGTGALVFADSPALTGTPTAPTAAPATNTTQIATTAFVIANAGGGSGLPLNYLSGFTLSNNVTDSTNDIDVAVGAARDSTDAYNIELTSAITKRLDAAWAVGTGNGGLDTGSIADTTYHVWVIARSDTGVVDVLFSTSATAPTMPANYDYKRRIGSIIRASAAIRGFTQVGDEFLLDTPVGDVNVTNPGTSAVTRTLSVPVGVKVRAIYGCRLLGTDAGEIYLLLSALDSTDVTPTSTLFTLSTTSGVSGSGENETVSAQITTRTNTAAQIRSRFSTSYAAASLRISTAGWIDQRGKE